MVSVNWWKSSWHQPSTSEPVEGLSILRSVMLQRLKQNPAALIGVLGALLLLMALRRRR